MLPADQAVLKRLVAQLWPEKNLKYRSLGLYWSSPTGDFSSYLSHYELVGVVIALRNKLIGINEWFVHLDKIEELEHPVHICNTTHSMSMFMAPWESQVIAIGRALKLDATDTEFADVAKRAVEEAAGPTGEGLTEADFTGASATSTVLA